MSSNSTSAEIHRFEQRYAAEPGSLVFARLADAYRKEGELERGLEVVEEGLARHPDYLSAHLVHARILRELERADDAVQALESALRLDAQNLVALRARAELAVEVRDPATAAVLYERILEIEPFDDAVRDSLRELRRAAPETEAGPEEVEAEVEEVEAEPSPDETVEPSSEDSGMEGADPAAREAWLAALDESPLAPPSTPEGSTDEAESAEGAYEPADESPGEGVLEPALPEESPSPSTAATEEAVLSDMAPLDSDPAHEVMTATMAELYLKQGLYEEAIAVYERLLEASPDDFRLIEKLKAAHLLRERGPSIRRQAPAAARPPTPQEDIEPEVPPQAESAPETELPTQPETEPPPPEMQPEPSDDTAGAQDWTIRTYLAALLGGRGSPVRGLDPGSPSRFQAWLREQEQERQGD